MDTVGLIALLREAVPTAQLEDAPGIDLQPTIYAARGDMPELTRTLRDRPELAYRLLIELTAVDYWPREPRFEVVYLLVSIAHRHLTTGEYATLVHDTVRAALQNARASV